MRGGVTPNGSVPFASIWPLGARDRMVRDLHSACIVQSESVRPTTDRDIALFWVASAILILNLLDAVLSLVAVHAGAATEANPLMAATLSWGAVWFILVKISLVSLGVLLLWRTRHVLLAAGGLVALCLLYVGLLAYHASAVGLVASRLT